MSARSRRWCCVCVAVLGVLSAGRAAEPPVGQPAPMPIFISGLVTLADGVTPVTKAIVTAAPPGGRDTSLWSSGITNADGAFVLSAPVKPGDYVLSVREVKTGANGVNVQTITVAADSGPIGVRLQLPSGSLSGRVSDPAGNAAPQAMVLAHETTTGANAVVHADANGDYLFDHLPAGKYDVTASPDPAAGGRFATARVKGVTVGSAGVRQDLPLRERAAK